MAELTRRTDRPTDWREWFPRRFFDIFDMPETLFSVERPIHVEEFTEDDHLVVKAELPGVDPAKDVHITVHDGLLDIRAERRQETKVEEKKQFRSEFRYGMFARTVPLPAGASDKDIEADYHDGVLKVRVPIGHEEAEARKIEVRRT